MDRFISQGHFFIFRRILSMGNKTCHSASKYQAGDDQNWELHKFGSLGNLFWVVQSQ
jgi:hypothetical protein